MTEIPIDDHYYRVYSANADGSDEILLALFLQLHEAEAYAKRKYEYTDYRVWVICPYKKTIVWSNTQ